MLALCTSYFCALPLKWEVQKQPYFPTWVRELTTNLENYTVLKILRDGHISEGLLDHAGCHVPHFYPERKIKMF